MAVDDLPVQPTQNPPTMPVQPNQNPAPTMPPTMLELFTKMHKENEILAVFIFGLLYTLKTGMPASKLKDSPTYLPSEKQLWRFCVGLSGAIFLLVSILLLLTWFARLIRRDGRFNPCHIRYVLRVAIVLTIIDTLVRDGLTDLDRWGWLYVFGIPIVVGVCYALLLKAIDHFFTNLRQEVTSYPIPPAAPLEAGHQSSVGDDGHSVVDIPANYSSELGPLSPEDQQSAVVVVPAASSFSLENQPLEAPTLSAVEASRMWTEAAYATATKSAAAVHATVSQAAANAHAMSVHFVSSAAAVRAEAAKHPSPPTTSRLPQEHPSLPTISRLSQEHPSPAVSPEIQSAP